MFLVSDAWRTTYRGAVAAAMMLAGVGNPQHHELLEQRKRELETTLRSRWAGQDRVSLAALPTIAAYSAYYARFRKTYHVLLQLESVALRCRPIPSVAALVEAMFMAELLDYLLTAGHDAAALEPLVVVDIAKGNEQYVTLDGKTRSVAPGDMYMRDRQGVISSVIYGPDQRTAITLATERVFFAVYAPPGIGGDAVRQHLDTILANVLVVAPGAEVEQSWLYEAA